MVRMERLELSRLSAPEPKSGVYTNFTTSALPTRERADRYTYKKGLRFRNPFYVLVCPGHLPVITHPTDVNMG